MFHKEGKSWILTSTILVIATIAVAYIFSLPIWLESLLIAVTSILWIIILQFFRNPTRDIAKVDDSILYAPADGKVVVIEETTENEYFQDRRIQVSIFMSPINVHVNRYPFSGRVLYTKYHPGKFLLAWNPKSSTENERNTVVLETATGNNKVLLRQIAGFLARRIVSYAEANTDCVQGEDFGFIKFGSRVDIFLPIGTDIKVKIGDKVKGNGTIIAQF